MHALYASLSRALSVPPDARRTALKVSMMFCLSALSFAALALTSALAFATFIFTIRASCSAFALLARAFSRFIFVTRAACSNASYSTRRRFSGPPSAARFASWSIPR